MSKEEQYSVINEQGDLGLNIFEVTEEEQKKLQNNKNKNK